MFNKTKSTINKHKDILITCTLIVVCTWLFFLLIVKRPFLLENDQWFQYNIFYKEWIRLVIDFLKGKGLPMYSWNMYLGTDFYSAMGYYCVGDIFLPVLLLFRNNVELGLIIEVILCFYISSILMAEYLEKYGVKNRKTTFFISLTYALGGQAFVFTGNYMFYRFYAFLPLLFIGLIKYFNNKKASTFIVATAILLLQNYYLMYPTLIFLFLFALMYEFKEDRKKEILKDFISLLISLLVGVLISAIVILPSIMYTIGNNRLGNSGSNSIFWQRNTYTAIYATFITYIPWSLDTMFKTTTDGGHDYFFSILVGIVPFISSLQYAFKREHKNELFLLIILFAIALVRPLSSIMHGFSLPSLRWVFLLGFYILTLAAVGFDSLKRKQFNIIFVVYMIILFIQVYSLYKNNYVDYWNVKDSLLIMLISILANVTIVILFNVKRNLAIVFSLLTLFSFRLTDVYIRTVVCDSYDATDTINKEDVEYYASIDEDVAYRYNHSYKNNNPNSILNQNKSLDYDFMSTATYNSMSDTNITNFNSMANASVAVDWALYVDDYYANNMLGTKYYIVYKDEELPENGDYEYAYNFGYLKVYKNLNYKGFGYSAKAIKYTDDFIDTKDFDEYIMVDDKTIDISKYNNLNCVKLDVTKKEYNCFKASISLDEDNIVLIPIPNNKGWSIKVNGEKVDAISVNGGFIGLELKNGYNEIEMHFTSPYFKEGCIMSISGLAILFIVIKKEKKLICKID